MNWLLHSFVIKAMQDFIIENIKFEYHEKSNIIFPDLHYWYRCLFGWNNYGESHACFCCSIWRVDVISLPYKQKVDTY